MVSGNTIIHWREMKPWSDIPPGQPGYFDQISKSDTLYTYQVKPSRKLSGVEIEEMLEFCRNTFGTGGVFPVLGSRWTMNPVHEIFKFRDRTDMVVFVVAFSG